MGVIVDVTVVEYSEMNNSGQKYSVPLCTDPLPGGSRWQLWLGTQSGGTYNNNEYICIYPTNT